MCALSYLRVVIREEIRRTPHQIGMIFRMLAHIFEHVAVCNVVLYRIAARVEVGVVQGAAGDNIGASLMRQPLS